MQTDPTTLTLEQHIRKMQIDMQYVLLSYMNERSKTVEEMAAKSGLSVYFVKTVASGKSKPTVSQMTDIMLACERVPRITYTDIPPKDDTEATTPA